jgi:hypothetical protein
MILFITTAVKTSNPTNFRNSLGYIGKFKEGGGGH